MMPQFANPATYRVDPNKLALGLAIFSFGLAKKLLIADRMGQYADMVFNGVHGGTIPTLVSSWLGVLAYTLQIYFDFSGYSDMAVGLSLCLGVRLPLNFNSPYKSTNIIDFWRRWHISLSSFLRDYLYVPLGGNRKGAARRYLNLFLTMLLGGLWHGAAWTFVIWGALHGAYLMINHLWNAKVRRGRPPGKLSAAAGLGAHFPVRHDRLGGVPRRQRRHRHAPLPRHARAERRAAVGLRRIHHSVPQARVLPDPAARHVHLPGTAAHDHPGALGAGGARRWPAGRAWPAR